MSTITSTIHYGVTLIPSGSTGSGSFLSPLTIASAAGVSYGTTGYVITGTGSLVNNGTVIQSGVNSGAIYLTGASSIVNTGTVLSPTGDNAVVLSGTSAGVDNLGQIRGLTGVELKGPGDSLTNLGTVLTTIAHYAVVLSGNNGDIFNAGLISGGSGVSVAGAGDIVSNLSTIAASTGNGVYFFQSGDLINGPSGSGTALVQGAIGVFFASGATGTIANDGTIVGQSYGIQFNGGTITNGGSGVTDALVQGSDGIYDTGAADVVQINNEATILGTGATAARDGIRILGTSATGDIANIGTAALIQGYNGVYIGGNGSVSNTGTIHADGTAGGYGINIAGNGTVSNAALVAGYDGGIAIGGNGSVTNTGTIRALATVAAAGLTINGTGTVANIGTAALIQGYRGVLIEGSGSVTNLGTISGLKEGSFPSSYYGVVLDGGGSVTNGGSGAPHALLSGADGVYVTGAAGSVINDATILARLKSGIYLAAGGSVINGGAAYAGASVYGKEYGIKAETVVATVTNFGSVGSGGSGFGIRLQDGGTVVDAGTISGGSDAIYFGGTYANGSSANNLLMLQPGYTINGAVLAAAAGNNTLGLQGNATTAVIVNYNSFASDDFQTIAFASTGAGATLVATYSSFPAAMIAGFTRVHDTIDVAGLTNASVGTISNASQLILTGTNSGGTSETVTLQLAGAVNSYANVTWTATNAGTVGTEIHPAAVPPTITVSGTVPFSGGESPVVLDNAIAISDPNGTILVDATVWINSGSIAGDVLNYTSLSGLGITGTFASGTLTLSGTSSIENYESALEKVTFGFNPANGDPTGGGADTSRTIDWSVNDGTLASATGSVTVNVTHVAPGVTAGGTVTFHGGGTAVVLDPTLTLSDVDSNGTLTGATISINTGGIAGDMLNYTSLTNSGIAGTYSAGTLTLTGAAGITSYATALESITYSFNPGTGDPTNGGADLSRVIDWSVTDGNTSNGVSNIGSTTLDLVHTPPTITVSNTATFIGGGAAVAIAPTVVATDLDSLGTLHSATVTIANFQTGDVLNFSTAVSGITGTYAAGTLTFHGDASLAAYETELESVSYITSPSSADPTDGGTRTSTVIDWSLNDGVAASNTGTTTLDLVHVAPAVTAGATVTFQGGGTAVALDPGLTLSDVDSNGTLTGATIIINSGSFVSGDVLNFSTPSASGITGTYNAGTLTLSGASSIANYQSALDSVRYSFNPGTGDPTRDGSDLSRIIDWSVTDGSTISGVSDIGSSVLNVVHTPPTITVSGTTAFAIGATAVALDQSVIITDPDSNAMLTGATVVIAEGFLNGDTLGFHNTASITGTYDVNVNAGTLVLSGTASIAAYESALASVTYSSSAGDPSNGGTDVARSITWVVDDGSSSNGISSAGATGLSLVRPPTISGTAADQPITDEQTIQPLSTVAITDPNSGQVETIVVTMSNNANGTLSDAFVGGTIINNGTYIVTGSTAAVTTALDELIFTPTKPEFAPGNTLVTTFTISATNSDGATESNSATSVLTTAVTPAISGEVLVQGVTAGSTLTPFGTVTVTDQGISPTETVTVTLSTPAAGTLSDSVGGTINPTTGVFAITGAPTLVSKALDALVFTPSQSTAWVDTTTFTLDVTGPGGSIGSSLIVAETQQILALGSLSASTPAALSVNSVSGSFGPTTKGAANEAIVLDPSSSTPYTLPTGYQAEFLSGSSATTLTDPSGGNALLAGNSGADTISSGAAGDTLIGAGAGSTMEFTNGATGGVAFAPLGGVIMQDAGNGDTLIGSSGSTTASLTGANALLFGQAGAASVSAGGQSNTIVGGSGGTTLKITNSASHDVLFSGSAPLTLSDAGSHDTLVGSTGTTAASLTGTSGLFFAEGNEDSVSASGHSDTLIGGSGQTTFQFGTAGVGGVAFGGSGALNISDAGSNDTMLGGSNSTNAAISGNDALFFTAGGNTSVSAGGQGDTLVGGSGQPILQFGTNATKGVIFGGTAAVTLSDAGTGDTLVGSSATTTVTLVGADATFFAGTGTVSAVDAGLNDTIVAQSAAVAITASGSGLVVFGGSGSLDFTGGSHGATVVAGSGNTSIAGGSGGLTLFGGANGAITYSGSAGGLFYVAGSGNETLNAGNSTTNNLMFGGSGKDSIAGGLGAGQGNDTMVAGTGNDTLAGNTNASSHDLLVFFAANGAAAPQDVVQNFTPSDVVLLSGYGANAAAAALASASTANGAVTLTLSDHTTITFTSVASVSSLTGHVVST